MLTRQPQGVFQITHCFREFWPLGGVPSSVQLGVILLYSEKESPQNDSIKMDWLFRGHVNGCPGSSRAMQMGELGQFQVITSESKTTKSIPNPVTGCMVITYKRLACLPSIQRPAGSSVKLWLACECCPSVPRGLFLCEIIRIMLTVSRLPCREPAQGLCGPGALWRNVTDLRWAITSNIY